MGFNAKQPGKIKKADFMLLAAAIVVFSALLFWAIRG